MDDDDKKILADAIADELEDSAYGIGTEADRDLTARLVVDRKSFLYLKGTELDYKEELMAAGFRVVNPNAKRTCGCGESFII